MKRGLLLAVIAVGFLLGLQAEAKDLTNRLGVGVKQSDSTASKLVVHYFPTALYTWVGGLALDTKEQNSYSELSVDLRRQIFFEDNLNFFAGGGIALISDETSGSAESGFALTGLAGVEFFFQGLENLGFQAEFGVQVRSVGSSRFRTVGGNFVRSGVVFYF